MKKSFTKKSIEKNIELLMDCFPNFKADEHCGFPNYIREKYKKLAYPSHHGWEYSIPLVPNYKMKDGSIVDIGIVINNPELLKETGDVYNFVSRMYVYSEEPSDYGSSEHISLGNEKDKAALLEMLLIGMIKDEYLNNCIGNHNKIAWRLLTSNVTLWDLEKWLEKEKGESK